MPQWVPLGDEDASRNRLGEDFSASTTRALSNGETAIILKQIKAMDPHRVHKKYFTKSVEYLNHYEGTLTLDATKVMRHDLEGKDFTEFEMGSLMNLKPADLQEAKGLIHSMHMQDQRPGLDEAITNFTTRLPLYLGTTTSGGSVVS